MHLKHEDYLERLKLVTYRDDGYVNNWFSNMLPLDDPFEHDGIKYFAAENFYQAMKIPAHRRDLRVEIAAMSPHASKGCFRKYPNKFVINDTWCLQVKVKAMRTVLDFKFAPGTSWHEKLIATGDEPIIEFNNWGDVFWGFDVNLLKGQNQLGKLLMSIRAGYVDTALENFMS